MENDVKELEAVNKRLKEELKYSKKRVSCSSTGGIRNSNGWTDNKAILADKVTEFSREYMFPCYKFLKEGRQDYNPMNKKSLPYFVGRKMADTYRSMKIPCWGLYNCLDRYRTYVRTYVHTFEYARKIAPSCRDLDLV